MPDDARFDANSDTFYGLRCTHQPSPWIGDYGRLAFIKNLGPRGFNIYQNLLSYRNRFQCHA